jgi:hypothetical protein
MLLAALTAFSLTSSSEAGTIKGAVTDGTAGINGAKVEVYRMENTTAPVANTKTFLDGTTDGLYIITTDSEGEPLSGDYQIKFSADGYADKWHEDAPMQGCATPVEVTASGETTVNMEFTAAGRGSISGTVRNSDDEPAPNAKVYLYRSSDTDNYMASATTSFVEDATKGTYTIKGVPTGKYKVKFFPYSGAYEWYKTDDEEESVFASDVNVTAPDATENIDAKLATGYRISGNTGHVARVKVIVYETTAEGGIGKVANSAESVLGSDIAIAGDYKVGNLPAGTYKVKFEAPDNSGLLDEWYDDTDATGATDVVVEANTPGINAELTQGGSISGNVTMADGSGGTIGIAGACIHVYDDAGKDQCPDYDDGSCSCKTDDGNNGTTLGNYLVKGLQFRTYTVKFAPPVDNDNLAYKWSDAVTLTSSNSIRTDLNAELAAGGSISGKVTGSDGTTGAGDVKVLVYESASEGVGKEANYAMTSSSGTYTVSNLPFSKYKVQFPSPDNSSLPDLWYKAPDATEEATEVEVTESSNPSDIDVQLPANSSISGKVVIKANGDNEEDSPFKCAEVALYGPDLPSGQPSSSLAAMLADHEGKYMFSRLITGSYKVQFANDNIIEPYIQWYNGRTEYKCATKVSVAESNPIENIDAAWPVEIQQCGNAGKLIPGLHILLLDR